VRGYVIDFIHVRGWPVFNVADIAVVVGIALVGLASVRGRRRDAPPANAA
jgi:lipoprotein signal peptidase